MTTTGDDPGTHPRRQYLRFAALGDSTTFGIGDPIPGGWRGWARLLADALATTYDVSFCNLAVSGATAASVREGQLEEAVRHRPDVASLMVGVNDTLKSTWDPARVLDDLMACAEKLTAAGALLLTPRFHDHGDVFAFPGFLRRPLSRRIGTLNEVWDEVYAVHGGLRLDLSTHAEVWCRENWSVDRMHPSERGHRLLARCWAEQLQAAGFAFEPPSADPCGGIPPSWRRDVAWVVAEGAPWIGRRARDLGPWAVRTAWEGARGRAVPAPAVLPPRPREGLQAAAAWDTARDAARDAARDPARDPAQGEGGARQPVA